MCNIKDVRCKPRLYDLGNLFNLSMAGLLRDVVVVAVHRSTLLAILTMKKELHGFLIYACMWFSNCSYSYGALPKLR